MHFRELVMVAVDLGTGRISVLAKKGSRSRATSAEDTGIMRGSALAAKEKAKRAVKIQREKEKELKRVTKAKAKEEREQEYSKAKEKERTEKAKADSMS